MRQQNIDPDKVYTQGEVCAMAEAVIGTSLHLAIRYNLGPGLFDEAMSFWNDIMRYAPHEHVLNLHEDTCYACGVEMEGE